MKLITLARAEIEKLVGSRRGMLSLLAFVLVWLLVLRYAIAPAAKMLGTGDDDGLVEFLLSQLGLEALTSWPALQLAIYWVIGLYMLPLFAVVTAADQMASDRSRGTLRYLVMRASRLELFFGRFLGHAFIQLLMVLITLASVLVFIAIDTPDRLPDSLSRSLMVVLNLWLVLLPYVALMAWVSVIARSPRQATTLAIIIWIVVSLLIGWVQAKYGPMQWLDWTLPGSQVSALLRLSDWKTLDLALIPVLHTLVLLGIGAVTMARRDL
jgi:ABC-type transport system involved in multi-copper enzyme maturation permease subunit